MTRSPLDLVIEKLEQLGRPVKHSGDQVNGCCPAHNDQTPSLSVRYDRPGGKVLLRCHVGCDPAEIVAALGLSWEQLFDPKPEQDRSRRPAQFSVAAYPYTDEHGVVLFEKVRYGPVKDFRIRRPDGHRGWIWTLGDTRRVLFRLPAVLAAVETGRQVFVVEGEKDVLAAEEAGVVATTTYEGAAKDEQKPKWRDAYTTTLRGADVVVVADNDGPGYAHARAAAEKLRGVAKRVRVMRVKPDFVGADLSDHLDAGHGVEDLVPVGGSVDEDAAQDQEQLPITAHRDPALTPGAMGDPPPRDNLHGAHLLDAVEKFVRRFVALPSVSAYAAVTLWAAHTHLIGSFENTPRLAFLSPEPGSGKTRAQEILELLVPAPMHVLNASPAAIFRTIQIQRPTLLLDEVDTVFTRKGKDDEHQDLRGLLNSGYRAGATIPRCVGPRHEVQMFPTFCAVALAGLGDLPDTLMTRSVIIRMRRRAPGERVESFRRRLHRFEGEELRDRMVDWAAEIASKVTDAFPELPDGITDRPADVWEPLLAVAEAAGGEWPERARTACVEIVKSSASTDSGSLGVRLLADLRRVFGTADHLFTETILESLHAIDDAPWSDLRGKPLDARGLSNRLKQYGIARAKVRIGDTVRQGYKSTDLHDPWQRYLSSLKPADGEHEEHTEPARSEVPDSVPQVDSHEEQPEHLDLDVPEHEFDEEHDSPALTSGVPHVPHVPEPAMHRPRACPQCAATSTDIVAGRCHRCRRAA